MKLLLTSWWITNKSIEKALFDLVWKKAEETIIAVIPTASNMEKWDKTWLINDLINLKNLNLKSIEITDFTATTPEIYFESFKKADVLFFEWWNTAYLMTKLIEYWLDKKLKDILKNKVYVWVSAWSMVSSKDLLIKTFNELYEEDSLLEKNIEWLNLVDFYFLPHLNTKFFKKIRKKNILKIWKKIKGKIYVLDDNSAIKINAEKLEVVSEWEWFCLN